MLVTFEKMADRAEFNYNRVNLTGGSGIGDVNGE